MGCDPILASTLPFQFSVPDCTRNPRKWYKGRHPFCGTSPIDTPTVPHLPHPPPARPAARRLRKALVVKASVS
jgi:hypothetical protein